MSTIIRTPEQIAALRAVLTEKLRTLPAYNAFGESNEDAIRESDEWIHELRLALDGIVWDKESEIGLWLTNPQSSLGKDYGISD